jgi:Rne/Rng family ribonuclease
MASPGRRTIGVRLEENVMAKELIVSATSLEKKIAIIEDDQVTQIFIERDQSRNILGNVYKGRVTRVLPGMQAAFVDIGLERNAFLYVTDFFEDYEEYGELFKTTGAGVEDLLEEAEKGGERPSGRRGRRSRRSSERRERGRKEPVPSEAAESKASQPETAAGAPSGPLEPAAVVSVAGSVDAFLEGVPRILPEELELWVSPPSERVPSEEGYPAKPKILPDRLENVARPSRSRASRRPTRRRTPRRKARVDEKPGILPFTPPRNHSSRRRRSSQQDSGPLIGDLLKEGQEILVQVAKEPIGKKGARITSHIVLPGRFLVFMPTVNHVGVSRRIESAKERQRLRDLVLELRGEVERGFIVRTAGEGKTRPELRQDMVYLTRLWEQLRAKGEQKSAPALLHSELDMVQRVTRDFFSEEFRAIRVDEEEEYTRLVEFISNFNPAMVHRVRLYNKRTPIFDEFNITSEIEKALKSKVWLKNGGYIVINQTEALVAIDVNTGKYVGRTNSLEDTIAKTNMDAVREVVRQIRLRDLGGIIIVDFIDMVDPRNQQRVWEALQNELRKDKSPSKVLPFNEFGLVAITRRRVRQSLERTLCQPCPTCEGSGMTKSVRTVCYALHGEIRRGLSSLGQGRELIIRCNPDVGQALKTTERRVRDDLAEMTGKEITILTDPLMHIEHYDLVEA